MTVRNGICKGGPWDSKVKAFQSHRVQLANGGASWTVGGLMDNPDGTYYWRDAAGPTPGSWLWVPTNKEKK